MKRILTFLLLLACCAGLWLNVSAYSGLQTLDVSAIVDSSGSCDVNVSGTLSFEAAVTGPVFPIPEAATDITLNGQKVSAPVKGSVRQVPLKGLTGDRAGEFSFSLHYRLPGAVTTAEEGMELKLPLLSGFAYPVEALTFQIQLPGDITERPVFTSSYYQELIEAQMDLNLSGNTLSGSCGALKDHETVTVTLPVTEALFPQAAVAARVMSIIDVAILAAVVLALAYYLLTLRPHLFRREPRSTPPDGVCAGDLQLWLSGRGIDLSMMVVTWAQLGYLRIQVDSNNRVLLHKRMDMGNERSSFENRYFQRLFGKRRIVDGTGEHYARLCRHLWGQTPQIRDIYKRHSGNPKLFLTLCAIAGSLSGINLASGFDAHSLFLKVLFALVIGAFSLAVQAWGRAIPQRRRLACRIGGVCAGIWLLLGILSGEVAGACLMAAFQLLAGIGAAYGGLRTLLGKQAMEQIFNLRLHLCRVSQPELKRLLKANSGYFYEMAPYALALNADRRFARQFGQLRFQECSYLIASTRQQMTATEWARLLRTTVQILDARAQRLPMERLTGK